ncbi:MAG: hypothetical protein HYS17_10885 [Micavibrio aeruginosavorus]|uniref:Uncharacterized protein n=1 Tax=Micavibrio aeruginosavorus TaxID=349221 RepID=A0A7T5UG86_9BACT|nr:MAG: hypothetical protein HYS17_10885 [Micavibrio aeruginosavorus]
MKKSNAQSMAPQYVLLTVDELAGQGSAKYIMKLDARALYNLAAEPLYAHERGKEQEAYFNSMLGRGAVISDYKTESGGIIPGERHYDRNGKLTWLMHFKDGKRHDPGKGMAASVCYAAPDYDWVSTIAHYKDDNVINPAKDEPAIQKFDRNGVIVGATSYYPSGPIVLSPEKVRFLNIRKGLLPPDLPSYLQAYKLEG